MVIQIEEKNLNPQFVQAIQTAIEAASRLPEDEQSELAQFILADAEEWTWEGPEEFHSSVEEVRAEIAADNYLTLEDYIRKKQQNIPAPKLLQTFKFAFGHPRVQQRQIARFVYEEMEEMEWEESPEFRASLEKEDAEYAASKGMTLEEYYRQIKAEGS